ncbi:TBC1 domain family member 20-like, partial [Oscarella lobularis]|uniref:TBC1 domain family member 20-like n=1 Tax=Oscarella lobularis TaxID=121494 RepID=UPI003313946B
AYDELKVVLHVELGPDERREKVRRINAALDSDPVDIVSLRDCATLSGGLVNDSVRQRVWPKLLGVNAYQKTKKTDAQTLQSHRDHGQVLLDVRRSDRRFPPDTKASFRRFKQSQLTELIMRVLHQNKSLYYYQGFHELSVPFLLICGPDVAVQLLNQLCHTHLRDFMETSIAQSDSLLSFLYPIIAREDKPLQDFLQLSEVGTVFCLSWILTWFSHVLTNWGAVVRLYDLFLASHPLMPVYLSAAVVLHVRDDVVSVNCELSAVHAALRWPSSLPLERIIRQAIRLFAAYPPALIASRNNLRLENSLGIRNYTKTLLPQLVQLRSDRALAARTKNGYLLHHQYVDDDDQTLSKQNIRYVVICAVVVTLVYFLYAAL